MTVCFQNRFMIELFNFQENAQNRKSKKSESFMSTASIMNLNIEYAKKGCFIFDWQCNSTPTKADNPPPIMKWCMEVMGYVTDGKELTKKVQLFIFQNKSYHYTFVTNNFIDYRLHFFNL